MRTLEPHLNLPARPDRKPGALGILHVVSSLRMGGMEQFVLRTVRAQREAGHAPSVLTFHEGALSQEAERAAVGVHVVGGKLAGRLLRSSALVRRLRPDVIHVHNESSLPYGVAGKLASGAPVVLTCHGAAGGGHRRLSSLEERWTDAVVAVSRGAAEQVPSPLLRMRSEVIPNGVQPTLPARDRAAVRADLGLESDQIAVAMVARIDGKKGHDTLVRALARLPKGARIVALVAGEGDAAPAIRKLAAELGLGPERLRMLGLRRDVPDLLHASDIFALPSLYEGLPLSILEAMSQGLPVVATPVGGIPEVVTQGREGILVPKEDPAALAAAVQRLAGDADLRARLGSAGRQRALSEFSFETMLDRYDRLYRRLLFGRGAA